MPNDRAPSSKQQTGQAGRQRSAQTSPAPAIMEQPIHPLLQLQQQVGNAQVARLMAQAQDVQIRRQADEDAKEVQTQRGASSPSRIDQGTEVQLVRDMPEVGLEGGPISDQLSAQIRGSQSGGAPLNKEVRSKMEGSFGADLSDVRLHTDSHAAAISRSLTAKAFTTGNHIYFGQGAAPTDSHLLAHEMTHVVQQRGMPTTSGPMTVNRDGDQREQEANAMAATINRLPAHTPAQVSEETSTIASHDGSKTGA